MQRQSSSEEIRKQLQQEIDLHTALEDHIQLKMTNAGVRILVMVISKFKNDHSTSANLAYLWLKKLHQYEPLILANVLICHGEIINTKAIHYVRQICLDKENNGTN